ncbi:hypothetical protein BJ170DRAFT_611687 [Xylariales sp. AK1849]|nr:hypothetical protein BJ170DRAFT_611687 [Xylariales sp. AK1849]
MSMGQAMPNRDAAGPSSPAMPLPSSHSLKSQRVLSCILCQQRKVKCDRRLPCSNCIKSRAECVPAPVTRRRPRRRFPEKDLLERLRRYEELLHHNNISFEPLLKDPAAEKTSPTAEGGGYVSDDDHQPEATGIDSPSSSTATKADRALQYEAKNLWQAMNHGFRADHDNKSNFSDDDVHEIVVKQAWNQACGDKVFLVLGSRTTAAVLSTLHPEPVQIFRFWQIYLDNVNPLIKVTHPPSLQGRIIEAASNLEDVNPNLEALMFSIYCMSVLSISAADCQTMFGSSKEDLLSKYQSGCQQALLNSGLLRTGDRDCLTALYLYIISADPGADPLSLSCMLGVAIRIARRLGIHSESILAKCTPFEAEMRRRLWWSLILFDTRIGEMGDYRSVSLDPAWDCKIPLNVNDSDLRPEMKEAPAAQGYSTDTIYAVVRGELGDFIRHSNFHLEFTNPALKPIARNVQYGTTPEGSELVLLERMIEDKYLKFCDPEIPLHYMTIWMTRGHLARCRLLEEYSRCGSSSKPSARQLDGQLDIAIAHAFRMLECDTKVMASPLTRGYLWLAHFHFQFIAYIPIVQELRRSPDSKHAERAWETMSDNFEARFAATSTEYGPHIGPHIELFAKTVLPAWKAREATARDSGESLTPPRIVQFLRQQLVQMGRDPDNGEVVKTTKQQSNNDTSLDDIDFSMSMPMNFGSGSLLFGMGIGGQDSYAGTGPVVNPALSGQTPLDVDMNQGNWAAMDWGLGGRRVW